MKLTLTVCVSAAFFCAPRGMGQEPPPKREAAPIYKVTVIERTAKAVNYGYRTGPTMIDFRGTVLLGDAKGEATVESKRGHTEIEARFENILPPARFGREYLTYTLWAVTPEGAARNLGEIVPNGANKAKLRVTTELQAFGLIVTAEPYSSTRQPSDVVVLENEIRPDTVGKVQEIRARYELMPRGHYTWEVPRESKAEVAGLPKVSMDRYEALLELYEAQNATEIARAAGAEQYATRTFEKSLQLLENARRLDAAKSSTSKVVQEAREAAQTADDARVIAERGRQEEKLAAAESAANSAKQQQTEAQADAQRAKNWAEAERAARERAEADAAEARAIAAQAATNHAPVTAAPPPPPPPAPKRPADTEKTELRMALLQQLNSVLSTRDTARGLVVTIPDSEFSGSELNRPASDRVARLAAIVAPHAGLRADVEGHTDSAAAEAVSWKRAETVRRYLAGQGLSADKVSAQGLGSSRPLGPNSTANGREQNRRVEIVISGDPIGSLPVWDRTYSLIPRR